MRGRRSDVGGFGRHFQAKEAIRQAFEVATPGRVQDPTSSTLSRSFETDLRSALGVCHFSAFGPPEVGAPRTSRGGDARRPLLEISLGFPSFTSVFAWIKKKRGERATGGEENGKDAVSA